MPCVYTTPEGICYGKAPLSPNEHYLPRALGNFQNDERLVDRICGNCQSACSKLEDVFAHNSPEAFFREMIGRVGRKNHRGKNIFYEPTHGIPPLAILGRMRDLPHLTARRNYCWSARHRRCAMRLSCFGKPRAKAICWLRTISLIATRRV